MIEKFGIPLDEYPKRCIEQIERWKGHAEAYRSADKIEVQQSKEYASSIGSTSCHHFLECTFRAESKALNRR
ncbi:hypothetical protein RLEG3_06505 (plasmid) [Rhizobium leguminosarum bv. trifolii WSM1689]|nr:hypothetical protein RLEG3_06505 [Rhizobium leguminosarum bv. trifolii WSM1689]